MKEKYRLSIGRGLPLGGPRRLSAASMVRPAASTLLSSKTSLAIVAVAGALTAVLLLLRRTRSDEDEPSVTPSSQAESKRLDSVPAQSTTGAATTVATPLPQGVNATEEPMPARETESQSVWQKLSDAWTDFFTPEKKEPSKEPKSTNPEGQPKPTRVQHLEDSQVAVARFNRLYSQGKYSSAEVEQLKSVVLSGLTTKATTGSQMPEYIKAEIVAAAERHGLDPTSMLRVASLESGGNPNAISATGAVGVFQFTAATASDFGLTNRFDYKANINAAMLLAKRSQRSLQNAGFDKAADSPLGLYIAHQIGAQGAKEVFSKGPRAKISSLSESTQRNIRNNLGGKSKTVGEYLKANADALKSTYDTQLSSTTPAAATVPTVSAAPREVAPRVATAQGSNQSAPPVPTPVAAAPAAPVTSSSKPVGLASVGGRSSTQPNPSKSVAADTSFSPKDEQVALADNKPSENSTQGPDDFSEGESNFPSFAPPQSIKKLPTGQMINYG